jgi:hypothetical protein
VEGGVAGGLHSKFCLINKRAQEFHYINEMMIFIQILIKQIDKFEQKCMKSTKSKQKLMALFPTSL